MKSMTWLVRLMLPYWRRILLALILSTLAISSHIGLMTASAYLLARAALHPSILDLMVTIVGVRFFGLSRSVFRYAERYVSHDVTFRVLSRIRVSFYQALEPLAPARLRNFHSGDILSRIVADVETQQNLYLRIFAPQLVALLVLCGYGIFLARFDLRFSIILATCYLLAGLGIPWAVKYLSQGIGKQLITLHAELTTQVTEWLSGLTELLVYGQAQDHLERIQVMEKKLGRQQQKIKMLSAFSGALTGMIANLCLWLVLVLGILLVERGQLKGVNLGMLALGTFSSFEALFPLALVPHYLEQNRTAADRLLEVINTEPMVISKATQFLQPEQLDVAFQDVCFRYEQGDALALDNVSFRIRGQSKVAIVGASGAGKSSILNLLLRFWEYDNGRIELGGHSFRDYPEQEIRSLIGVVTQQTHLFNATIRENLLLAKPDASEEELISAAQQAQLHDYILSLPQGYDSLVGEGGFALSGGQRQRLALARVFLKSAPMLIMDEAMTGLDSLTEREIMNELDRFMKGRTTLLITHRLIGLEKMDEILVLDQGKLVEQGTHGELLQLRGVYWKLWCEMNREY